MTGRETSKARNKDSKLQCNSFVRGEEHSSSFLLAAFYLFISHQHECIK